MSSDGKATAVLTDVREPFYQRRTTARAARPSVDRRWTNDEHRSKLGEKADRIEGKESGRAAVEAAADLLATPGATDCIRVPLFETSSPPQSSAKSR
jgi:hypothetical protein